MMKPSWPGVLKLVKLSLTIIRGGAQRVSAVTVRVRAPKANGGDGEKKKFNTLALKAYGYSTFRTLYLIYLCAPNMIITHNNRAKETSSQRKILYS